MMVVVVGSKDSSSHPERSLSHLKWWFVEFYCIISQVFFLYISTAKCLHRPTQKPIYGYIHIHPNPINPTSSLIASCSNICLYLLLWVRFRRTHRRTWTRLHSTFFLIFLKISLLFRLPHSSAKVGEVSEKGCGQFCQSFPDNGCC